MEFLSPAAEYAIFNVNPLKVCLPPAKFVVFCKIVANSLDPDQARQNVGPDLDPICLTHW